MATTLEKRYEVIAVGAGIMGSATAYYLAKHYGPGKVLLLEQYDWLHRRGSSHGESRIIRRMYEQDYYGFLTKNAYKLWEDAQQESGTRVFTQTGGLDFGARDSRSMASVIAAARKNGVPHEILSKTELEARFPTVTVSDDEIVVYSPDSGILNATKSVAMFQSLAKANGAHMKDNSAVCKVEKLTDGSGDYRVTTQNGDMFLCKKCVLTSGSWTPKLVEKCFGIKLPVQPDQTTIAYWKVSDPAAYSSARFPIFIYHQDDPDSSALCYATPAHEYPQMIKVSAHFGIACDPDKRTYEPCMEPLRKDVLDFIQTHLKGVSHTPTLTETCIYQTTPDENFILDQLPEHPNIVIGCGFSGHGFKLGPVVGKYLTQLIVNGQSPYPELSQHFVLSRFNKS